MEQNNVFTEEEYEILINSIDKENAEKFIKGAELIMIGSSVINMVLKDILKPKFDAVDIEPTFILTDKGAEIANRLTEKDGDDFVNQMKNLTEQKG